MNGISTPQRNAFYMRYKKSGIFDDEDPLLDKSQNITTKVNKGKCAYQFKPVYDECGARDRYLKQYWDIDVKKNQQLFKEEDKPNVDQSFSARRQYIKEFLTNNIFQESIGDIKANSMKLNRSKSFFQPRTKVNIVLDGDTDCGKAQFQKMEEMASNIFNIREKETIVLKTDNQSSSVSTGDSISIPVPTKTEKSKIPSVLDWRYNNIELGMKNHLIRSKTIDPSLRKQEDLISHFEQDEKKKKMINSRNNNNFDREMFLPVYATKSIDIRPNRNLVHCFPEDKEVESYELTTKEHFDIVDCRKIQKLFYSNGIHMYNFYVKSTPVDGFQSGRISIKIRKEKNDQEITRKLAQIKEEVRSMGLKMQKIVKDTHIKKERKPTPGTELLKKAKKKIVLGQE